MLSEQYRAPQTYAFLNLCAFASVKAWPVNDNGIALDVGIRMVVENHMNDESIEDSLQIFGGHWRVLQERGALCTHRP